ncbi:MAG: FAD-dependent oxidoreductase [Chloroherpetonaceae bacterium]|nr:FAD-binding oxidoreductase [Chloroherpetonaceae bacterium]MCS7211510.1 FAD-binding oxidoreductase [Chloroherpetonaceae bacterium]MDW8019216.1 FAD-dependent oxidoreductase [Chloroherpetonaceae bacterium]MDW8467098.1 FAD-dependent oxidoreductase [Chloroherpetonaceae bacterium]
MRTVTIIGAGVMGLSTAVRLLEQHPELHLKVLAKALPPETTSNVAAAIWYPYNARPIERMKGWCKAAFERFKQLAADPAAGVSMVDFIALYAEPTPNLWWRETVEQIRRLSQSELPAGFADGYLAKVPLVETNVYMPYLLRWAQHLGAEVVQAEVHSVQALAQTSALVVNCAGLGARELCGDEALYPIRGQVLSVARPKQVQGYTFDNPPCPTRPTYIIPRSHDVILGGSADIGEWDCTPDETLSSDIVARCVALEPHLQGMPILGAKVGLRPGRTEVRLERDPKWPNVIHNYGHGGSGITLSWGCAEEVCQLAAAVLQDRVND